MILIVLALICMLTVPLTGGRLSRLANLQLRWLWAAPAALILQIAITEVVPHANHNTLAAVHIVSYVLVIAFLVANRKITGVPIIAIGALSNALVIVSNRGVMAASAHAQQLAGLTLNDQFHNSVVLANPRLLFLGDIIPVPGPLPNVLSPGDCVIFLGMLVLLHSTCRRRSQVTEEAGIVLQGVELDDAVVAAAATGSGPLPLGAAAMAAASSAMPIGNAAIKAAPVEFDSTPAVMPLGTAAMGAAHSAMPIGAAAMEAAAPTATPAPMPIGVAAMDAEAPAPMAIGNAAMEAAAPAFMAIEAEPLEPVDLDSSSPPFRASALDAPIVEVPEGPAVKAKKFGRKAPRESVATPMPVFMEEPEAPSYASALGGVAAIEVSAPQVTARYVAMPQDHVTLPDVRPRDEALIAAQRMVRMTWQAGVMGAAIGFVLNRTRSRTTA